MQNKPSGSTDDLPLLQPRLGVTRYPGAPLVETDEITILQYHLSMNSDELPLLMTEKWPAEESEDQSN